MAATKRKPGKPKSKRMTAREQRDYLRKMAGWPPSKGT